MSKAFQVGQKVRVLRDVRGDIKKGDIGRVFSEIHRGNYFVEFPYIQMATELREDLLEAIDAEERTL